MTGIPTFAPGSFRMPNAAHARVEDAMHPGVITCSADTPLREVARMMATKHIHCIVVSGAGASGTWGVIAGLDLIGAAAEGIEERTAGDIAASELITVRADDPLERAAQLMMEHRVEHLVAADAADGHPVGVLSSLDIAGVLAWGEV